MKFEPFYANIPQIALDELREHLACIRWPDELPGVGWQYGVPSSYVRRLVEHWNNGYDWRSWEAKLNSYPQFTTEIDGQKIHFLHVRSPEPDARPLILTHGWPGSVFEYIKVIDHLSNPKAYGSDPQDAFHLVIPSLPGFGFSGPTHEPGWNPGRIARAWIELMHGLGYERYGAVGNDWGTHISLLMGQLAPHHIIGTHVTQIFMTPSGELTDPTPEEQQALESLQWFEKNMAAYDKFQSQQPQTLAFALTNSFVGFLAWICQIYREGIEDDFVLTHACLYWLTGTIASSARIYYEYAHMEPVTEPNMTPVGLTMFRDDFKSFRRLAEQVHKNIIQWAEYDTSGHYAAYQVPDLLASEVRNFFRSLH